ncbi:hypothetical protein OLX13_09560 [Streptococcus agalactiae]|jgi:hypothetical protein|uniref:hypothetical protein n=2 Tax=Lactobacillales TaxID=186826 RepID=UPI0022236374|nr:hypothetical protein [Streptococcus agalactiae]MCW1378907.1 hypothetical protein [Streptococcus agalactiae]
MVSFLQRFLGSTSRNYFIVVFWLLLSLIAFIVFVFNFASLWQDIAYWIVPSKDLYINKPEIIRDLIKVVSMIILGIVVFVIGIRQGLKNYYGDYSGDTKQQ